VALRPDAIHIGAVLFQNKEILRKLPVQYHKWLFVRGSPLAVILGLVGRPTAHNTLRLASIAQVICSLAGVHISHEKSSIGQWYERPGP